MSESNAAEGSGADTEEIDHDGYLVTMNDETVCLCSAEEESSALRYVLPGVYHTEDAALAQRLVDCGVAECFEPNARAELFDMPTVGGGTALNGWLYEYVKGDYALDLGLTGSGVRIAVIDSGVKTTSVDLKNAKLGTGKSYSTLFSTIEDNVGHGTCVTQMIAADQNGIGTTGVAAGATIISLRCFWTGAGSGTSDILSRAVRDAVDVYDCDIINMSWGMSSDNSTLRSAIKYAYSKGAILVAAAGNTSRDYPQGTVLYPAAYDEVIGVGSLMSSGAIASTSQQTKAVFVCVPGDKIPYVDLNDTASTWSGTSFAAPCVSGLLALAKEQLPTLDGGSAKQLLQLRAEDLGTEGWDKTFGYGKIDAELLLSEDVPQKLVAVYEGGRLISVTSHQETLALVTRKIEKTDRDGRTIRLFLLDEDCLPVSPMLEWKDST